MKVILVKTWQELLEVLFSESWNPNLERFRSKEAYRGLSTAGYPLETTLMRLGGNYAKLEKHLLRNFRKYAHRNMVEKDSIWHWLTLAQHHGLPTRLLDWTYSPFAALHFATANIEKFNTDGVIWAVNYVNMHHHLPKNLSHQLHQEGANVFTIEMLSESISSLDHFDTLTQKEFAIFVEPPSIDDRIVNQHALFTLMPSPEAKLDEDLIAKNENIGRKIIIPHHLKWEIRDKLDQANVNERVLFPGLDGLSSWLRRQYSPRSFPLP